MNDDAQNKQKTKQNIVIHQIHSDSLFTFTKLIIIVVWAMNFVCSFARLQNSKTASKIKFNKKPIQNIAAKNKSFFFVRSNYFVVKGKFFFTRLLALPVVVVCTRANEHNMKKKIKTIYVYKIVYICIVRKWVRDIFRSSWGYFPISKGNNFVLTWFSLPDVFFLLLSFFLWKLGL